MEQLFTAEFDSPIGALRIASTEKGLAYVELPHASGRGFGGWCRRHAAAARVSEGFAANRAAVAQLLEYLAGKRVAFDLALDLRATPFQSAVYDEVAAIPYGESRSYAEIAARVAKPRAVRAVGAANGANPIPLVVPCHRVVGSRGQLQGYAGGLELKARLLAMEGARQPRGFVLD